MRAVIDTCVIIDFLTGRDLSLSENANTILSFCYLKKFEGFVTANSVTDIYYVIHRVLHDKKESLTILNNLIDYVNILDVKAEDCKNALIRDGKDFEDSVLIECAVRQHADYIVTDNIKDFEKSPVKVVTSKEFVDILTSLLANGNF